MLGRHDVGDGLASQPLASQTLASETYHSPGLVRLDSRGSWWAEFREDVARYAAVSNRRWATMISTPALWALLQYRVASALYRRGSAGVAVTVAMEVTQKMAEILTRVSLPYRVDLAPGLYIAGNGPTVIEEGTVIATGCNLGGRVTIEASKATGRRGAPRIGQRVFIGLGAVITGPVTVGDDAVIDAHAVVYSDVPPHCTVAGNPAGVVSQRGTAGKGLHQRPRT